MSDSSDILDVPTVVLKPKRSKAPVISTKEKAILLELVRQRLKIIGDCHSNPKIIFKKQKAWDEIAKKFKMEPDCHCRTSVQLKKYWENLKGVAKKEVISKCSLEFHSTD